MNRLQKFAIAAVFVGGITVAGFQAFVSSNAAVAATVEHQAFTPAVFAAAQKAGKPILIDVWASWCPVCRAQQPAIAAAQAIPANRGLVILRINYDTQKAEQKPFAITRQATLIAFKGKRETGRLVAQTDPAQIAKLVATTR